MAHQNYRKCNRISTTINTISTGRNFKLFVSFFLNSVEKNNPMENSMVSNIQTGLEGPSLIYDQRILKYQKSIPLAVL